MLTKMYVLQCVSQTLPCEADDSIQRSMLPTLERQSRRYRQGKVTAVPLSFQGFSHRPHHLPLAPVGPLLGSSTIDMCQQQCYLLRAMPVVLSLVHRSSTSLQHNVYAASIFVAEFKQPVNMHCFICEYVNWCIHRASIDSQVWKKGLSNILSYFFHNCRQKKYPCTTLIMFPQATNLWT